MAQRGNSRATSRGMIGRDQLVAAWRFELNKTRIWRKDDAARHGAQTQAIIDIIERYRKMDFIHAAEREIVAPSGQKAGRRYRAAFMGDAKQVAIAGIVRGAVVEGMGRGEVRTQHHAAMLNHAARPGEQRADGANIGVGQARAHLIKPVAVERLYVIVEEQETIGNGFARREIVKAGVIKGPRHMEHARSALLLQSGEEAERLVLAGVVVDDNEIDVGCDVAQGAGSPDKLQ